MNFKGVFLSTALTLAPPALAQSMLSGIVTDVHDGDTLTVRLTMGDTARVRLSWIDAPELKQPDGPWAQQTLAALVNQREVLIDKAGIDRYGRWLGVVYLNVNAALVQQGAAWVYRSYPHPATLETLETAAQQQRLGVFTADHPCPPWRYRRRQCGK